MVMVSITRNKELGIRFDPIQLKERLLEYIPETEFEFGDQFEKQIKSLQERLKRGEVHQLILDSTIRFAKRAGPAYAFKIDASGVLIKGNVRSVDAVFLMDQKPPQSYWQKIIEFARSIDGGLLEIKE